MSLVFDNFSGKLATLDGVNCGAALFSAAYIPASGDTTVGALTGELTGGSYGRQTFTAAWDSATKALGIDEADQWPSFDAAGTSADIAKVVYYRVSDSKVISVVDYPVQPGVNGWSLHPVNGFARVGQSQTIGDRLTALEAGTTAGVAPVDGDVPPSALADALAPYLDLTATGTLTASFFGQVNPPHAVGLFPAVDVGATLADITALPAGPYTNIGSAAYGTVLTDPTWEDVPKHWTEFITNSDAARMGTTVAMDEATIQAYVLPLWEAGDPIWFRNVVILPDGTAITQFTYYAGITEDDTDDISAWLFMGGVRTKFEIPGASPTNTQGTAVNHDLKLPPFMPRQHSDDHLYDNTVSGLTATNVQGAIDEIAGGGGGGGSVATDTIYDAKGDLPVGTGSNTAAKLTVGANGTLLMAASGETTGAKWADAATVKSALGLENVTNHAQAIAGRLVSAGTGLTGGGDLSADRTLSIDTSVTVDKTTAQTLSNKTLTAPAISSPTGLVKADVGLGSVTNDAQLKIASNLSDLGSAATARTNLGLAIGTDVQAYDSDLAAVAGLSPSNDDILQRKSGAWANRTLAQVMADVMPLMFGSTSLSVFSAPSASVGTYAPTAGSNAVYLISSSTAVDDYIQWANFPLAAGTYTVSLTHMTGTGNGQLRISIDGTNIGSGVIESYAASTAAAREVISGVSIASSGLHTVRITTPSKNASSSAYVMRLVDLAFARTA